MTCTVFGLKGGDSRADIHPDMIISDEQVQRVVEYLHTPEQYAVPKRAALAAAPALELVERVVHQLSETPDVRQDRVAEAREMLCGHMPNSDVVAGKLIGRVLSDSVR
jgi:hypothetical protein